MTETVPQWLISGFARSSSNLGATASRGDLEALATQLAQVWSAPERCYHNLTHLKDTLENVEFLAEQARDIEALRLAAWFHGAIFDVSPDAIAQGLGGIDILASARFAAEKLESVGMPRETVAKVVALIESLYQHKSNEDIDAQVLSDADLAVLAADPEDYLDYLRLIRQEYHAYSDAEFRQTRLSIIVSLLARPQLFYTHMASTWEEPARENIRAEQERLLKAGGLPAESPQTHQPGDFLEDSEVSSKKISIPAEGRKSAVGFQAPVVTQPAATPATDTTAEPATRLTQALTPSPTDSTDTEEVNPLAPIDDADLGSSLENVEEIMDTMVIKALKPEESLLKPMSDPKK
ncbi:hypothetical protein FYZ41_07825 [Mobiluncus mulieris]|uniref:HD domain-containing protein n=1 Tax=Mobiluncus mulieris TaxID=2052 RepID=UPI0021E2E1AB|nr:hypothetical protein [Mobiluncus mulieris]MCV0012066.1 hypothetical protein [Mobiluncus mulieris]